MRTTTDAEKLCNKFSLSKTPPIECRFTIGDEVIYTNDAGIKFNMTVIGFSDDTNFYGRFIHLVTHNTDGSGSAWWFPHHPAEIQPVI